MSLKEGVNVGGMFTFVVLILFQSVDELASSLQAIRSRLAATTPLRRYDPSR